MNLILFAKFRSYLVALSVYTLVGLGLSFGPTPAFSCNNYVGTICVDKKKKVKKKKRSSSKKRVRKKSVAKPKVQPEPEVIAEPVPVVKTADSCVIVSRKIGGFRGQSLRQVTYTFRNTCNEEVLAFAITNPCYRWVAASTKRLKRNRVKIKGNRKSTFSTHQATLMLTNGERGIFANYDFSATPRKKRKKYPDWPDACTKK